MDCWGLFWIHRGFFVDFRRIECNRVLIGETKKQNPQLIHSVRTLDWILWGWIFRGDRFAGDGFGFVREYFVQTSENKNEIIQHEMSLVANLSKELVQRKSSFPYVFKSIVNYNYS